jgi:hypothetical protein
MNPLLELGGRLVGAAVFAAGVGFIAAARKEERDGVRI